MNLGWLADRPTWLTAMLAMRNASFRFRRWWWVCLLLLVLLGWLLSWTEVSGTIGKAARHPLAVSVLTALLFGYLTARGKLRLKAKATRTWLGSLPADASIGERVAVMRTSALILGAIWLAALVLAGRLRADAAAPLGSALAAGLCCGTLAGWLIPLRPSPVTPGSWYAVARRVRARWAVNSSTLPLGYWPLAQARVSGRPKRLARRAIGIMMAMPSEVIGVAALAAVIVWFVTFHLQSLLFSVVRVLFGAARWLAATPIGLVRFGFSVAHKAFLKQTVICSLLIWGAYELVDRHAAYRTALVVAGWSVVFLAVSVTTCVVAFQPTSVIRSRLYRWMS